MTDHLTPVPQEQSRGVLDRAREALTALEDVIGYAAGLEAERDKLIRWHREDNTQMARMWTHNTELRENLQAVKAGWDVARAERDAYRERALDAENRSIVDGREVCADCQRPVPDGPCGVHSPGAVFQRACREAARLRAERDQALARVAEKPAEPSPADAPVRLDNQRLAEALTAYEGHPNLGFACCTAHAVAEHVPALLTEIQRLKAELADFSGRVNEPAATTDEPGMQHAVRITNPEES